MPYFTILGNAISAPMRRLYAEGFLLSAEDGGMLPTTFAVLKAERRYCNPYGIV